MDGVTADLRGVEVLCHVCAAADLLIVPGYEDLLRVTSDAKPWSKGGCLAVCRTCGCVQKPNTEAWRAEIEKVYAGYSIYAQSGGVEQAVFDSASGQPSLRSQRLLSCLRAHVRLPDEGRLLDVGCGNGAFLRASAEVLPRWRRVGTELSNKYRDVVEALPGVEAHYTCPPDQVPGRFDLITMIHVLEHIPAPRNFLIRLRDRLAPGGVLLVQVPDYLQRPADLLVVDHASHFTAATARTLIEGAGYNVAVTATDWVANELTVVARPCAVPAGAEPLAAATKAVEWLQAVATAAQDCAPEGRLGLFGTSTAAAWLFGTLKERVEFFVDEDPNRVGKTFLGRPIYHPREALRGSHVFLALPRKLAEAVERRVTQPGVTFHLPPQAAGDSGEAPGGEK